MLVCRDRSDTRTEAAFYLLVSQQESCLALAHGRSAESLRPPGCGWQGAGDRGAQAPHRHDGRREGTSTSASTAAHGDFGQAGDLEENSPSKVTRWQAAGTARAATVQHPPGHAAKESSASPASQERHGEPSGATPTLPSSLCSARDLEISI